MSSTRLLVLGVVRIFQPVHGYDVRRELLSWRADQWAHINPGSIYHALKTLARDGYLRAVDVRSEGSRPERTAYELTEDGEQEFFLLLRDSLWRITESPLSLRAGLGFFPFLSRDEVATLLRNRIAQLEAELDSLRFVVEAGFKPAHVVEHFHLTGALIRAEISWARDFLTRLEQGEYEMADSATS